jgi:hypothetical protein
MADFHHSEIARRKVSSPNRSDVRFQGVLACFFTLPRIRSAVVRLDDVVVQGRRRANGRRLTCSDARVGYRLSDFRPGLFPVLRRASARSWPQAIAREFPTVDPPPALHDSRFAPTLLLRLANDYA